MKVGDITPVLRDHARVSSSSSSSRWTTATVKPFEEARDEIGDRVADEKRRGEFEKYLEKLRGAGDHRVEERRDQEGVARSG